MKTNENEPNVELLEPPAGMRWEYRGRGFRKADTAICYTDRSLTGFTFRTNCASGCPDHHYWEAVPAPKTVKQWLETLPDGYRERALANCTRPDGLETSLHHTIPAAFRWADTPEGGKFWKQVYLWACNPDKNPLPPLPDDRNDLTCDQSEIEKLEAEITKLKSELATLQIPCVTEPAAYPPPESEWPEKPAPPEGCEWVRQDMTGHYPVDQEHITLMKSRGTHVWDREYLSSGYENCVVFRAEKIDHTEGGKYRMLEEGETILDGDAYLEEHGWAKGTFVVGERLSLLPGDIWRRPVEPVELFTKELAKDYHHKVEELRAENRRLLKRNVGLKKNTDALARWKRDALAVESEWDCQAVGEAIGLTLGQKIHPAILPWILDAKAKLAKIHILSNP